MSAGKVQIIPIRKQHVAEVSTTPPSHTPSVHESSDGASSSKQPKKPRKGMPKVRTGCITCKIRRVKCDEAKPECNRCSSTGRRCDGYVVPGPRRSKSRATGVISIIPALHFEQGEQAERRALDYFRGRSAPSLASHFDAEFWSRIVLQIGQTEPAIRHAMIAVGALNEQRERQTRSIPVRAMLVTDPMAADVPRLPKQPEQNDPLALIHYNKAILALSERMRSATSDTTDITLLACILFICVEMLRGDDCPAMKHVKSGMVIALTACGKTSSDTAYTQLQSMRHSMLPFFNRLELLSMIFGHDPTWDYPIPLSEALPEAFDSMSHARDCLIHVSNLSIRFMRTVRFKRYDNSSTTEDRVNHQKHVASLEAWRDIFDNYLEAQGQVLADLEAAKVLEIHRIVGLAWLKRCMDPEETATDKDMAEFEIAINMAETLQQPADTPTKNAQPSTCFLFDMEVIAPLYLIATKCRHPQLRRRAIALLRATVRREGLWDSQETAAIAERIMEHEEAELSTLDGSELPAEDMRIHNTHIENTPVLNFSLHSLTFYSRPDGNWKVWEEQMVLQTMDGESIGTDETKAMSLHWKFPLEQVRPVNAVLGHACEIAGVRHAQR